MFNKTIENLMLVTATRQDFGNYAVYHNYRYLLHYLIMLKIVLFK